MRHSKNRWREKREHEDEFRGIIFASQRLIRLPQNLFFHIMLSTGRVDGVLYLALSFVL